MTEPTTEELDFLSSCGVADMPLFIEKCMKYQELLYRTNETFNLTRIPETEFFTKHVCDSVSIARFLPSFLKSEKLRVCDIGCGAGIPSLFLAAAYPCVRMTAVDSRGKKVKFVELAARTMGLVNLTAVHGRANELGSEKRFLNAFDIVTARAVSDAAGLIFESERLLSRNGVLAVYRTPVQMSEELPMLERARVDFSVSDSLELPSGAGTRLFLTIKQQPPTHKDKH